MSAFYIQRPETILFVGAGASQQLSMPTTDDQAGVPWTFCDGELTKEAVEEATKGSGCFVGQGQLLVDMLTVIDGGSDGESMADLPRDLKKRAFPGLSDEQIRSVVFRLRRHYDWGALKLVAKAKKGDSKDSTPVENYVQMIFTLIDTCTREDRGFAVYDGKGERIFISVDRLKAARETMVLIENTMFACAWAKLTTHECWRFDKYRKFFYSLAKLMQDEGQRFETAGCTGNLPEFYQFSYSLMTTNFEPLFLWFIWTAHDKVNHEAEVRIGNPGRMLKLLMNFPNTVGMRKPNDVGGTSKPSADIWFPCTDAAAQNLNNPKHNDDRIVRMGKYYALHGMSNTRHCPMCGRLNLYMGDTWDENSTSLFPNGIIASLANKQVARTEDEEVAKGRGEYDALSCHFCGELTYSYDNFMFMQTQLKNLPPSFIKETTDEALAGIAGAKHIVLLGYSMPLDDAIWGSLFTAMSRRQAGEKLFCSVVDYVGGCEDKWYVKDELDQFLSGVKESRAIKNTVAVFGKDCVRAYVCGVPGVFGEGTIEDVKRLMYPYDQFGWDIPEFTANGVMRRSVRS